MSFFKNAVETTKRRLTIMVPFQLYDRIESLRAAAAQEGLCFDFVDVLEAAVSKLERQLAKLISDRQSDDPDSVIAEGDQTDPADKKDHSSSSVQTKNEHAGNMGAFSDFQV